MFCHLIVLFCLLVWDPGGRQGDTERIFNQLQCPVASIEALSTAHQLSVDVLDTVSTSALPGHQNGQRVRCICFDCVFCLFVWDPGGCRGDMEQIFDQLRCPVA